MGASRQGGSQLGKVELTVKSAWLVAVIADIRHRTLLRCGGKETARRTHGQTNRQTDRHNASSHSQSMNARNFDDGETMRRTETAQKVDSTLSRTAW